MSPKLGTRQPRRKPFRLTREDVGEPPKERRFWVGILVPENCTGLRPGYPLQVHEGDQTARVLDGVKLIGELERAGVTWLRTHGHSSCVFVRYGPDPSKRLQVKIAAR